MSAALRADSAELRRAASLLCEPDEVHELRAIETTKRTASGYFDNFAELVASAAECSDRLRAEGVYLTLNPVHRNVFARSANQLTSYAKHTTADTEITGRRWLLVDCDPKRPSGISSTDTEHEAALELARKVREHLTACGWPASAFILADSGNGAHLLIRIELPNDDAARDLLKRVLEALDMLFSDDTVCVDKGNFNAARICKFYGSPARKGSDVVERPHRGTQILEASATIAIVARDQLEALAALMPRPEPQQSSRNGYPGSNFDLEQFINAHGIEFQRETSWQGGRRFILKHCLFDETHGGSSAAIIELVNGAIAYKCLHNSCANRTWADVRELFEPGYRTRHQAGPPPGTGNGANSVAEPRAWPVMDKAAFHGLAGEFVDLIDPHTEADRVALLIQFLAGYGNAAGRNLYAVADGTRHYLTLDLILAGDTSKARKGTSWSRAKQPFEIIDKDWARERISHGLSSGEGLIWEVRDPIFKRKKKGGDYQEVEIDSGISDKRLLVVEPEFASVLKVADREGNILSMVVRQAYDGGKLGTMVKNSPAKATGAHISIVGHITIEELQRYFDRTEAANGFGNRFIFLLVKRSKFLPFGGEVNDVSLQAIAERLRQALEFARKHGPMKFSDEARESWIEVYPTLSAGRPGLLGHLLARSEAQTLRLSCIYAGLDKSTDICPEHLEAALAVWEYSEASAEYIFGDRMGDPDADAILTALRSSPGGLSRTEISNLFERHRDAVQIERALGVLLRANLASFQAKGSHTPERWFAKPV